MLTVSAVSGFGARAASPLPGFMADLDAAGIAGANLHFCLDSGALESYASGQTWSDLTSNGIDTQRGTSSGSDATDPAHNGTPGDLSSTEYWSFDGGDYFLKPTTNSTELNAMHKDNAKWAVAIWEYVVSGEDGIFSTVNAPSNRNGVVMLHAPLIQQLQVAHASGAALGDKNGATSIKNTAWNLECFVVDEAGGSVSFHYLGNADGNGYNQVGGGNTYDAAYTSPSSTNSDPLQISGARGTGQILASGARIGMVAMWSGGTLPTKAQFDTFYTSSKVRWGL
jgi:hypothetical protein